MMRNTTRFSRSKSTNLPTKFYEYFHRNAALHTVLFVDQLQPMNFLKPSARLDLIPSPIPVRQLLRFTAPRSPFFHYPATGQPLHLEICKCRGKRPHPGSFFRASLCNVECKCVFPLILLP